MTSERTVRSQEIGPDEMRAYRAAKALHRDGGTPASAFGLLAAIVEDRTWERLRDNADRPFTSFTAFVEAVEPGGLGTTVEELRKLLRLRHPHEDGDTWGARAPWLRAQVARLLGEDIEPAAAHGEIGGGHGRLSATHSGQAARDANAVVARLKRDDPTLAAEVVEGRISANAAARRKGWRKPRVVLSSPSAVAQRLRQHFSTEEIAELRAHLDETGAR